VFISCLSLAPALVRSLLRVVAALTSVTKSATRLGPKLKDPALLAL
jgi:hypothetical protein